MSTVAPPRTAPTTRRSRTREPVRRPRPARRVAGLLGLLAGAVLAAAIAMKLLSHELTDDTYAFLDWGRDLRHGYLPLLENRTFHPLPILTGSVLSLFGRSSPNVTILAAVTGLVLLSVGVWRITRLLGFDQPAPLVASLLALTSPMLVAIAFAAYINLPFAALITWAVVWELRGERRLTWTILVIAGFVRPEGWGFLVAYGVLDWWRLGRPGPSRQLAILLALSFGPMIVWSGLEWALFGSPLYSFTNTHAPGQVTAASSSISGLWHTLVFCLAVPIIVAAVIGVAAVWRFSPRREAATMLGATALAACTVLFLAGTKFNIPDRQMSAFVSLLCPLAAAGACAPAEWFHRRRPRKHLTAFALGVAGSLLMLGLSIGTVHYKLVFDFNVFRVQRITGDELDHTLQRTLPRLDVTGARRHVVAATAAVDGSEVAWDLGVPYDVVYFETNSETRLLVQPSAKTLTRLRKRHLTSGYLVSVPRGWRLVTGGPWRVWAAQPQNPVRLGGPSPS